MLRNVIEKLSNMNELMFCNTEVDPVFELGAVLKYFRNKKPIIFNNIKNSKIKIAGGLYGDRDIFYKLLNVDKENRLFRFMDAIANPKPYKIASSGPVKENIIKANIDIPKMFPIPKFQEKDISNFITAGILVVKDPETKKFYTSVRRFQVNGGNKLSALIVSPMLTEVFLNLEKQNKPLDIAIVLGYDAYFLLASQVSSSTYGVDKYEIDSALRGEPLELVKCETSDILVPSYAEIILEGKIVPGIREMEGPFGELMGAYSSPALQPVIEINAITHRNDPIFQVSFPCREEHVSNGLIREIELYNNLKNQVDVVDVNVTEGGGYRFNAVISINKKDNGDGKSAILAALGTNKDLKHVVIVDPDVNIYDVQDVEWAITTRSQANEDFVIIPNALGSSLDPSHSIKKVTDKVGIDATKPIEDKNGKFERAIIPGYENIDINRYFPNFK